jgi:hypothetical protein
MCTVCVRCVDVTYTCLIYNSDSKIDFDPQKCEIEIVGRFVSSKSDLDDSKGRLTAFVVVALSFI